MFIVVSFCLDHVKGLRGPVGPPGEVGYRGQPVSINLYLKMCVCVLCVVMYICTWRVWFVSQCTYVHGGCGLCCNVHMYMESVGLCRNVHTV